MNIRSLLPTVAVLVLLAACAGAPAVVGSRSTGAPGGEVALAKRLDEMGYSDKKEIKRLSNHRFNGWNYVDKYHVVINFSPTKHYLIQFRTACHDLRHATSIGFKTTMSSVSRGDRLVVRAMHDRLQDCWVATIYELTRKPREEKSGD